MTQRLHPRPWHRGSLFGDGLRQVLDRNRRARFRFLVRAHNSAGRITPKGEWVGEALVKRLGSDGQCDPSHATLAADARGIDPSTVGRALADMRALGLVAWQRRLVRAGWRAEQTSNAYVLLPNPGAFAPAQSCDRQPAQETRSFDKSKELPSAPTPSTADVEAAQAALARRRAVIVERVLRNRTGQPPGG